MQIRLSEEELQHLLEHQPIGKALEILWQPVRLEAEKNEWAYKELRRLRKKRGLSMEGTVLRILDQLLPNREFTDIRVEASEEVQKEIVEGMDAARGLGLVSVILEPRRSLVVIRVWHNENACHPDAKEMQDTDQKRIG